MAIDVQFLNVKILASHAAIDLGDAIPVFHRWIQERVCEELLIDVADYRHVPNGPGVLLIGYEANYSLDLGDGELGLLYNRKTDAKGNTQDKLLQAFFKALEACRRLEEDSHFTGALKFDSGRCAVTINDRLLAPNTDETWRSLETEFDDFAKGLFGPGNFTLHHRDDPRERFRVDVRASAFIPVSSFLKEAGC